MKCQYCKNFYMSKIEEKINETVKIKGEKLKRKRIKIKHQKFCEVINRFVSKSTPACDSFKLKKFFFCKKNGYYVSVLICQNRKRPRIQTINAYIPCKRCKQWKEWEELLPKIKLKRKRIELPVVVEKMKLKKRRLKDVERNAISGCSKGEGSKRKPLRLRNFLKRQRA